LEGARCHVGVILQLSEAREPAMSAFCDDHKYSVISVHPNVSAARERVLGIFNPYRYLYPSAAMSFAVPQKSYRSGQRE
jgi:hypothetical protein